MIITSSVHHNSAQDAILTALDGRVVVISPVHCHRVDNALPVVFVGIVRIHGWVLGTAAGIDETESNLNSWAGRTLHSATLTQTHCCACCGFLTHSLRSEKDPSSELLLLLLFHYLFVSLVHSGKDFSVGISGNHK